MIRRILIAALAASLPGAAQVGIENRRFMEGRKHILFLGGSQYYAHDAVSKSMFTMAKLGEQSGLWDVMFRTDYRLLSRTPIKQYLNSKNLGYFDAIMLFTQGEFRLTDEQKADLVAFVREDGKGLMAAHSGVDINTWEFDPAGKMRVKDDGRWPGLIELLGGVFVNHPWRQTVKVNVEDRDFPATRHFPKVIEIEDEIYQMDQLSRNNVRVLMSLDVSTVDLKNPPLAPVVRKDLDFPLAWAKKEGAGRVFVSPLGHIMGHWDRPDMQKMWLEAAKWVLKLSEGDATPTGQKKGAKN